jgi:hypothetical protein
MQKDQKDCDKGDGGIIKFLVNAIFGGFLGLFLTYTILPPQRFVQPLELQLLPKKTVEQFVTMPFDGEVFINLDVEGTGEEPVGKGADLRITKLVVLPDADDTQSDGPCGREEEIGFYLGPGKGRQIKISCGMLIVKAQKRLKVKFNIENATVHVRLKINYFSIDSPFANLKLWL